MVLFARDEVLASVDDFDKDPWLFNAVDVTVDLRTGAAREHRPGDMITKVAGTSYTAQPDTPFEETRFYRFLNEVFSEKPDMVRYVQQVSGYAMTDVTREEHFWLAHGQDGRNGKTTFFDITGKAMGDYAVTGRTEMIVDHGNNLQKSFDLATMVGARRVTYRETKAGQKLNEDLIKELTGGDKGVMAEAKFKQPFRFNPHFKMFLYTNHLPPIEEVGNSMWERLRVIPFEECYIVGKQGCHEPNPDLERELEESELSAVLRWMVNGAVDWYKHGLIEPEGIKLATQQYQEENDDFAQFLREEITVDKSFESSLKDLYDAYSKWWQGEHWEIPLKTTFGKSLVEHGFKSRKSHGRVMYRGLLIKSTLHSDYDDSDPDPESDPD